jgi:GNAT superfamily N-acetyltransferase
MPLNDFFMHQVLPEYYSRLRRFFTDLPPNAPMVESFLAGRAPGRAYIDSLRRPQACVIAMNYSFVFFGGVPTADFERKALIELKKDRDLYVVWSGGRSRVPKKPPADDIVDRIEYRRRENRGPLHLASLIADGSVGEVRRIDAALFKRCHWRGEVIKATGSATKFLKHGFGFCLVADDVILSEAYACFWGGGSVEIATVTHPDHRGKGYAPAICAHLIQACEGLGLETYWSCDVQNRASIQVAAKLGFTDTRAYRLLHYNHAPFPAFV